MYVACEVPESLVLDLVERGLLGLPDADNQTKVGEALLRVAQDVVDGRFIVQKQPWQKPCPQVLV